MDIALASSLKESYAPFDARPATETQRRLRTLLGVAFSALAALVSWNCNTHMGYPLGLKVLSALLAFMFGGVYLLYYVLVRSDICRLVGAGRR